KRVVALGVGQSSVQQVEIIAVLLVQGYDCTLLRCAVNCKVTGNSVILKLSQLVIRITSSQILSLRIDLIDQHAVSEAGLHSEVVETGSISIGDIHQLAVHVLDLYKGGVLVAVLVQDHATDCSSGLVGVTVEI